MLAMAKPGCVQQLHITYYLQILSLSFTLVLQCLHCPKVFINRSFLDAHMTKRHCDSVDNQQVSAVSAARPATAVTSVSTSQSPELDTIKRRLQQTEQRLLEETDARNAVESKVHTHTHTEPFNGLWSGTTRVGWYQKKHSPTHTHPDHRTSFINFLQLLRSVASSLFNLRA